MYFLPKSLEKKEITLDLNHDIIFYWSHYQLPEDKVQLFWEGHKNGRKRPYGFEIYLENNKTLRAIAQIFMAFSEKLNFIF